MDIVFTDGADGDFNRLCQELDENLDEIVGGAIQRDKYAQYNLTDDIHDVCVVYVQQKGARVPVACGGFKKYVPKAWDAGFDNAAELKRMFVKPECRGNGFSKIVLTRLEDRARQAGFEKMVLESGELLESAMGLYNASGYKRIGNYGQYAGMDESICMEKML